MTTDERDLQPAPGHRPLRFFIAFQKSRAAFYALAVASALVAEWLRVIEVSGAHFAAIFGAGTLSVLAFLWLYRRRDEAGALRLAPWHIGVDILLVSSGVTASGGIQSPWWIWYLAIAGGAAFLGSKVLTSFAAAGCVASYLAALWWMGEFAPGRGSLALAVTRMIFLFGASVFLVRGVLKLRESQLLVRRLQSAGQRRIQELSTLTEELDRANASLRDLSLTDPLTGLHNRRFVEEKIGEDVALVRRAYGNRRYGRRQDPLNIDLGFLLVDIDHFKAINDRFGHQGGDLAIRHVCETLRSGLRQPDTLARWGGEEFLVLVRQTNGKYLAAVAERLVRAVRGSPVRLPEGDVALTCSVGWSYFPFGQTELDALDWNEVLHLADAGLYLAKEEGRDRAIGVLPGLTDLSPAEMSDAARDLDRAFAAGTLVPVRFAP
jgi:diguanylate cyclase (GGDEF)-like protein